MGTAMISPEIPLQAQAPKPTDPLEAYQRVMALRGQIGQQQLQQQALQTGALENQQKQIQLDQMHALNQAYASSIKPDGTFDQDALSGALIKSGHAEVLPQVLKSQLDLQKQFADTGKTRLEVANLQADSAGSFGKQLQTANYDPQLFLHGAQLAIQNKAVDPQALTAPIQAVQKSLLADPTGEQAKAIVKQFSDQAIASSEKWTALQAQQKTAEGAADRGTAALGELALKQKADLASQLAASTNKDSYARAYYGAPPAVAAKFPHPDTFDPQTTPQQARLIGQTPEQQQQSQQAATNEADRVANEKALRNIAQGHLAIANKEFEAKFGDNQIQAWTDAVKKNPDVLDQLPPEAKMAVGGRLVAQGGQIPAKLGEALKTQEANSQIAISHINRVQQMLNDPDLQNSFGPIMGRIAKGETRLGTDILSSNPVVAQKQQNLLTSLNYLFIREGKALFGGRPPQKLMEDLEKNSANPVMSKNFMKGSLDAAQASAENTIKATNAFRYGSAAAQGTGQTGTTPNAPTVPADKAAKINDYINRATQQ